MFEWDTQKNLLNQKKHGVSFEEAIQIWEKPYVEVEDIAYTKTEKRSATLGKIGEKLYVAIWTKRKEKIRLITVRRARKNEEKIYQEKISIC